MSRLALTLSAAFAIGTVALADLGPPPGQKYITVVNAVKLEKEFPDYSFYVIGFGPGAAPLTKVELDLKKATKVDAKSRYGGSFFAVPNSLVKEYKTEKELAAAITKEKPPAGVSSVGIGNRTVVKDSDKRASIDRVFVISTGDEKTGLKIAEEKAEPKEPEKKEEEQAAAAPTGRLVLVGIAAALALAFGGVWLVRRK